MAAAVVRPRALEEVSPEVSAVRTRAMRALLENHQGVISFDVFDTLLWRRYPRPIDVFHDIPRAAARAGLKLPPVDGPTFAAARRRSEAGARVRAREDHATTEVTLRQVHAQLALLLGWDADDAGMLDDLAAAELAAELDAVVADRELLELVVELTEDDRRLAVVADSYLSSSHLHLLLCGGGYPENAFERIFVSSAFGVSKDSGLFEVVAKELDIHPGSLLHVGDLPATDVTPVRELGGRVVRWPIARDEAIALMAEETGSEALPMRICNVGGDTTASDAGLTSLRARLIPPDDMSDDRARVMSGYERFGRLVYGPVLTGFANWLCARAKELGIERLYFFQREGELLAELVGRTSQALGRTLDTTVLAVSRAALAPARHSRVDKTYLGDRIHGRRPRRAAEFIEEIGLDPADVAGWTHDRRVTRDDAEELFDLIAADPHVLAVVQRDLEHRRSNLLRYLAGSVDIDSEQIAVCDLGWAASIQHYLHHGLAHLGFGGMVRGFYLATNEGAERHISLDNRVEGFVANLGAPERFQPIFRNLEIIEQCCLERIGSVIGYDDEGCPTRSHDDIEPLQWNAIERVQDGARAFLDERLVHEQRHDQAISVEDVEVWRLNVRQILLRFCANPTFEEIELFRRWRHDDNRGARSVERMIPAVFEERGPAGALLAGALEMDELLWASAVATLNGDDQEAVPLTVTAVVNDAARALTLPAVNAVARQADELVAIYVGAEAHRIDTVRVAVACGPAIVKLRRVTVEIESADGSVVERLTTLQQVKVGRGAQSITDDLAVVKGSMLRLSIPLTAIGQRLLSDQRLRLLIELTADPFVPRRNPMVTAAVRTGEGAARWAADWALTRAVPGVLRLARSPAGRKVAHELVADLRKFDAARRARGRDDAG